MKNKIQSVDILLNNIFKIYFDFETTGRSRSRIVSIGYASDSEVFEDELLVMPAIRIDYGASIVHGFTHETLCAQNADTCKNQLSLFMKRIEELSIPVLLIAHNGKSFDTHVLRHEMVINGIQLPKNIVGFLDSLWFIRKKLEIKHASIDLLMDKFWKGELRTIHSALEDCKILKRIFEHVMSITDDKAAYLESTAEFMNRTNKWTNIDECVKDVLEELVFQIEKTCEHKTMNKSFVDINEKKYLNRCANCSHWFITFRE